jgi:predicted Zn finger-like uncharacterized protein
MSSSFVTQCPHCRTRFRVNHAQLGAANGAVRCGACMHVFDAARHLVADQPVVRIPPATTPEPTPTQPSPQPPLVENLPPAGGGFSATTSGTPPGKAPSDTLWIHDDLDIDDLDLDEELARLEREEVQFSQDFLALRQAPKPAEALLTGEPATRDSHDETWASALLNENSSESVVPNVPEPADSAPANDDPLGVPIDDDDLNPLDEPLNEAIDPPLGAVTDELRADTSVPRGQGRRRAEPAVSQTAGFDLVDEPVQLEWRPRAASRGRLWLWALLNLLALAVLAGQYVFRNFDDLARQDQFRPWFTEACPLLGCELPSKVDIGQIRSSNLMVRAHPEFSGALIVDAIIYNRAPFAQPFPLLEMRFADLQGKLIASRRFTPAEYLAGELAGKSEMPSQTPIRIALEILDPGRNAESYSLNFLSPE